MARLVENSLTSTRSWNASEEESLVTETTQCILSEKSRNGTPTSTTSNRRSSCLTGLKYRSRGSIGKGALLVMASSLALHMAMPYGLSAQLLMKIWNIQLPYPSIYRLLCILFPLSGWIADSMFGRYKVILYSTGILATSSLLMLVAFPLYTLTKDSTSDAHVGIIAASIIAGFAVALNFIGYAGVDANVIQFVTDQKLGASGEELSGIINIYFWVESIAKVVNILLSQFLLTDTTDNTIGITELLVAHFILSSVTLYCFASLKKYLDTTPRILNPIKLVFGVLKFAKKNKYPRNRSSLTFWEDTQLTRIDMAKSKYGGPFTEEQVEDVKTGFRLLPIILLTACIAGIVTCSKPCTHVLNSQSRIENDLLINHDFLNAALSILLIPVYHYIVYPIMYRHVPSLLKRMGLGLLLIAVALAYLTSLDPVRNYVDQVNTCVFANSTICIASDVNVVFCLPFTILVAVAQILIIVFGFEFIVAQSPQSMKGLAIGLWFACYGVVQIASLNLDKPFSFVHESSSVLTCGFYYFLTKTLVSILLFVLYIFLAKRYTMRVRNKPINVHIIAEDHFLKYIDDHDDSSGSTNSRRYSYDSDTSTCSSCTSN